ncbi:MAG: peptidoglycan recognition family protein [Dysosmobacter sp.]|uniref:peptidoglycan recognition protein family protein n=1 Tax=uncultured Oscillibacter sp. TaxID=876091 RepID=UPI00260CAF42|nr:peptidoglycan recognition family protein [uncultured Oscillibacter sp.]MCX4370832.1 peptidoglycan recognition family protein [Dysosmobacter sp.]
MERYRKRRLNPRFVILCAVLAALTLAVIAAGISKLLGGGALPAEETPVPAYVEKDYLTVNEWSRPGEALKKIKGVVIHYVGNPGTTAQANRNYFESLSSGSTATYASSHFIIGLEGEVIQCVPLTEIAYASNSRNGDTVSIEVCHPDETGVFSRPSYERCVELTAWLCHEFRLDPKEDVIRHYDVTGKLCPLYYVEDPEAWDAFLEDVSAAADALKAAEREAEENF